jgi:uncharacterized protein
MKILRRILKWMAGTILVLLLGGLVWLYFSAPYMIVKPFRQNFNITPATYNLPAERVEIPTHDSLTLRGYWIHTDKNRPVIIFVHGINACKERYLSSAAWLNEAGYDALLLDNRAHGESDGEYCTFGYYEKGDIASAVDFLEQRRPGIVAGVWGNSLGGAVALQALAYEKRLKFGIVESTFSSLRNVVHDYQERMFKVPLYSFTESTLQEAAKMAHFPVDAIQPAQAAKQISQPIFLAHGDADRNISINYGREIFANLASKDKTFYPVAGAGHHNLHRQGGAVLREAFTNFLKRVTH